MIQARASDLGDPIGTFTEINDGKQQAMFCDSPDVSKPRHS